MKIAIGLLLLFVGLMLGLGEVVAILDPVKINARVTVFVSIRTGSHSHEWLRRF